MWVKPDYNTAATTYAVLGNGSGPDEDRLYVAVSNKQARVNLYVDNADGWGDWVDIVDYNWMHIAVVRNATSGVNQFYINGQDAGSTTLSAGDNWIVGNIGAQDGTQPFDGTIADVRVYDSQLGSTELTSLAASIGTPTTTSPVAGSQL